MSIDVEHLIEAAREARKAAYAPYSRYEVGAAIASPDGRIWAGCNVENASYGLTICAERCAVIKMVSEGAREIAAVAVATSDAGTPCGACLQVLSEFIPNSHAVEIACEGDHGPAKRFTFAQLLPHRFEPADSRGAQ